MTNRIIYVNPNFASNLEKTETASVRKQATHINPLFLRQFILPIKNYEMNHANLIFPNNNGSEQCTIYREESDGPVLMNTTLTTDKIYESDHRNIICKSKTRLVRDTKSQFHGDNSILKNIQSGSTLINKSKLIRKHPVASSGFSINATISSNRIPSYVLQSPSCTNFVKSKYKVDNRMSDTKVICNANEKIDWKRRISITLKNNLRNQSNRFNKKWVLLNINGLYYKSNQNCLKLKSPRFRQESVTHSPISFNSSNVIKSTELTIYVRGIKYVLNANKFKLCRVFHNSNTSNDQETDSYAKPDLSQFNMASRINIGGLTYVSNSSRCVFARTRNHLNRTIINNAKQKSLLVLLKNRLIQTNVPCAIYQRVGKCAAFERGKCFKVHNQLRVNLCSKFLRGECLDTNCLLSHKVCLSKMPVCKFYLQGVCVRNNCPYLHKKVSDNAEICTEFLRGFCNLAEKCEKRHEFTCATMMHAGRCTRQKRTYCKNGNAKTRVRLDAIIPNQLQEKWHDTYDTGDNTSNKIAKLIENVRYFQNAALEFKSTEEIREDKLDEIIDYPVNMVVDQQNSREKLGQLPSYIPLM